MGYNWNKPERWKSSDQVEMEQRMRDHEEKKELKRKKEKIEQQLWVAYYFIKNDIRNEEMAEEIQRVANKLKNLHV